VAATFGVGMIGPPIEVSEESTSAKKSAAEKLQSPLICKTNSKKYFNNY